MNIVIIFLRNPQPIVNDGIEYKDDKNKSDGYSLIDGDKESSVDLMVMNGRLSKKN